MELDLELYLLSKELHIDVDAVRNWPYEKIMKWLIALGLIADNQKKAIEKTSQGNPEKGEIYRVEGDKIVYYS